MPIFLTEGGLTWFNLLAGLGGALWTGAYVAIIVRGFRKKVCCMPIEALAGNIVWECIFSSLVWTPESWQDVWQTRINLVWFCFDVLILATFVLYGRTRGARPRLFRLYGLVLIAGTAAIFGTLYVDAGSASILKLHRVSAFVVGVPMSFMFLRRMWASSDLSWQSMRIAWLRCLGTFVVTAGYTFLPGAEHIFVDMHGDSYLPIMLAGGWTSAVLDFAYVGLLRRRLHRAVSV